MVEAAVVMAVVLLVIAGAIQVGLAYHTVQRADATAAKAVAAAQTAGGNSAAGQQAAARVLAAAPIHDATVSVRRGSDTVTATVEGTVPQLLPGLRWHITRGAQAPVERFLAEPQRP